jgi:exonuclease SbcC
MRPISLRIQNIGPYKDETIQFSDIPGDVVAIMGQNGSGKTMMVDSVFAALYRYLPSRDSIYKFCTAKDAGLTFVFMADGLRFRTEIKINSKAREMEPWLFLYEAENAEYTPLTDGKNSTFDKKIAELVGPPEAALASVFAAQNRAGSFISLKPAKRKELFIDMLGLGKLQLVSDAASKYEAAAKIAYDKLSDRVELLKIEASKKGANLDDLYKQLDDIKAEVGILEVDLKLYSFQVGGLRAKVDMTKEIQDREAPIAKKLASINRDIAEVSRSLKETESLVAHVDTYKLLAIERDPAARELEKLQAEQSTYSSQELAYHRKLNQYNQAVATLEKERLTAKQKAQTCKGAVERAGSDAKIIDTVPCQGIGECAACQFLVNAIKARDEITDLEAGADDANAAILAIEQKIKELPRPAPQELKDIKERLDSISRAIPTLRTQLAEATAASDKAMKAESAMANLASLRSHLDRLTAERAEIGQQSQSIALEIKAAKEYATELHSVEAKLVGIQYEIDVAKAKLNQKFTEVSRAEADKAAASNAEEALAKLLPELESLDQDRKEWNLLSKAFSKTGIQSLEIDVAGPMISEMTNDLLLGCFGPRFAVRFVTQVPKDDGKGYKDDFDIYVTDGLSGGRDGSVDDLSGGEKVIVCESVALAISLFNRGRSRTGWTSLWRDEASSAVDDQKAPLYISMLRRARERGQFEKLYFISHQVRTTENADAKIIVSSGHVGFE